VPEAKSVGRLLKSQVPELRKIVTVDDLYAKRPEPIAPGQNLSDTAFLWRIFQPIRHIFWFPIT